MIKNGAKMIEIPAIMLISLVVLWAAALAFSIASNLNWMERYNTASDQLHSVNVERWELRKELEKRGVRIVSGAFEGDGHLVVEEKQR